MTNTPPGNDLDAAAVQDSRRQLAISAMGIGLSAGGFGFVFGLSARDAGFSPIEAMAMSTLVFGGAAQFAAVGYVASGLAWPGIILLTGLLNARHLLYSAALAPWLRPIPRIRRALMAHLLTDEAFALSIAHFERLGRVDERGYWIGAIASTFIPWNLATLAGATISGQIPNPTRFGLDVIFPAAMIGLAVGLVTGRREVVAAISGAALGVAVGLVAGTGPGVIVGGICGPLFGLAVPRRPGDERTALGTTGSAERYSMPGTHLEGTAAHQPSDTNRDGIP
jgi:branched chain amino acid efflux pump